MPIIPANCVAIANQATNAESNTGPSGNVPHILYLDLTNGNMYYVNTTTGDIEKTVYNTSFQNYIEVPVTSAQILAMGVTPIDLLPVLGADEYYEVKVILEFDYGTAVYVSPDKITVELNGLSTCLLKAQFITQAANQAAILDDFLVNSPNAGLGTVDHAFFTPTAGSLKLYTVDGTDPTLGDGTMLAKIWYTVHTFGATS